MSAERQRLWEDSPVEPETLAQGPPLGSLGRYQLLAKLGQGGMGTVYLARDTRLDRCVAVKVLPAESVDDPDALARFHREAKALAKLSHPGIVQAHDAEEHDGRHFLVMEYVEGTSLGQLLLESGHLSPGVAADYIHQAALALQHAHEKGLVHRDLKPSNLLLTPEKRIKILDLGLARFLQDQVDPGRTREGTGLGTPDYAAPEQFRDAHNADARADIYSLGCTLYHLLAGRVPFPGSSLSDKYRAHESKEPPLLEGLCPEIPTGLVATVGRMMAKRPAERFQTAQEAADALAPYVAGSSLSAARFKSTHTWHGSQLTVTAVQFPRRRPWLPWAVAGVAVVALLAVLVLAWPRLFPRAGPNQNPETIASGDGAPGSQSSNRSEQPVPPAVPGDPNVLTVSKEAKGGGQFRTIEVALRKVKPGMTIRVLDDATYTETLDIHRASQHTGVTLESPRRATIVIPAQTRIGISIVNVPRITLRGFRLRSAADGFVTVAAHGRCPGLVLEELEIEPGGVPGAAAISLEELSISDEEPPAVVRRCHIHGKQSKGVRVSGFVDYHTPSLCSRVLIQGNRFDDMVVGVLACGALRQIHIVGNQIWAAPLAGIQLENLMTGTRDILIANNTTFECAAGFRLWDGAVKGRNIQIRNNLFLASREPDMLFLDSGGDPQKMRRPGDGKLLLTTWQVDHNWREGEVPKGEDLFSKSWVPPSAKDMLRSRIEVRSRNADSPDFLRPGEKSELATAGGDEDPSLPRYVGAVPPDGVKPWDWNRTWRMPRPGLLLTVSKNSADGGQYRTIGAALAAAKPWATIRILDDGTYAESLVLERPKEQEGICLEALKQATIEVEPGAQRALVIDGVPHVRVSGFRIRQAGGKAGGVPGSTLVHLQSHVPGVVLEGCDLQGSRTVDGVRVLGWADVGEDPVVIARCTIHDAFLGIRLQGVQAPGTRSRPVRGLVIRDNRITRVITGIILLGTVTDTQVSGNLIWDFQQSGLQIQDLGPGSDRILFANNTALQGPICFRVWDSAPHKKYEPGQVAIRNNLLFRAIACDMSFVLDPNDGKNKPRPGDGQALIKLWRFDHNWRDLSGDEAHFLIPQAPADRQAEKIDVISREPTHVDFLRPAPGSELAQAGAGKEDTSLPSYVGAVPPRGVATWDWGRTWRWRAGGRRAEGKSEKP
jgi:serine/threonine protein kinase